MDASASSPLPVGRVALFNGPPSTGKTSLVQALQERVAGAWFHLSLDDFRAGYTERSWDGLDGQLFDRVLSGYLGSLREMALNGNDVMAEAVLTPDRRVLYDSTFHEVPMLLVSVKCDREVAIRREAARTDRRHGPIDLPAGDYAAVYEGLAYDLEVDTTTGEPGEWVDVVLPRFAVLEPSSFRDHVL
jgi:chloramphenicol 3-O phosphotransferase